MKQWQIHRDHGETAVCRENSSMSSEEKGQRFPPSSEFAVFMIEVMLGLSRETGTIL